MEIVGYTDENLLISEASPKSITLKVDKLKAIFSSEDFKYKMWFVPYVGAIKAEIEDISFQVTLTPKMQTTTDNKGYMFYEPLVEGVEVETDKMTFTSQLGLLNHVSDFLLPIFDFYVKQEIAN